MPLVKACNEQYITGLCDAPLQCTFWSISRSEELHFTWSAKRCNCRGDSSTSNLTFPDPVDIQTDRHCDYWTSCKKSTPEHFTPSSSYFQPTHSKWPRKQRQELSSSSYYLPLVLATITSRVVLEFHPSFPWWNTILKVNELNFIWWRDANPFNLVKQHVLFTETKMKK